MIYIILALLFYSLTQFFASIASKNTHSVVAPAITNAISALLPIGILFVEWSGLKVQKHPVKGITFALLAGVTIALFTIFMNKSYATNKVGIVVPIVFGGSIFLSTMLSSLILHESISRLQVFGLIFLFIGFTIIIFAKYTASL